jgi:hypothetical protein
MRGARLHSPICLYSVIPRLTDGLPDLLTNTQTSYIAQGLHEYLAAVFIALQRGVDAELV